MYDAYDSFYNHHNSWGYWGLLAYDPTSGTYTTRKRFYTFAQVARYAPAGSQRVGATASGAGLRAVAFYSSAAGRVTIVGRNTGGARTISGTLRNLPSVSTFQLYQTTSSVDFQRGADVTVTAGAFSVSVLGDGFFTLTGVTGAPGNQPPTVTITAPADGAAFTAPADITISASASDPDGTVTKVEFFQGATKLGEDLTNPYSFAWNAVPAGSYTLTAVATDNTGATATSAPVHITVNGPPPPPGNATSLWPSSATPTNPSDPDANAVELGVKFRSDVDGQITGIRFYKGTGNTGAHVGNLWTRAGVNLGRATFTGETASGWQQVDFAAPVAITAGTTYVASYFAPAGHYAADGGYFAGRGQDYPPLHALADGVDGGDGVYSYSATTTFPAQTFNATNYWVDVVFSAAAGGGGGVPPTSGGGGHHGGCGATGLEAALFVGLLFRVRRRLRRSPEVVRVL